MTDDNYKSWRKRKDFAYKLYEKFWDGQITEAELNKELEEYDKAEVQIPFCFHKEGQTPIEGWFICKLCGTNLRRV